MTQAGRSRIVFNPSSGAGKCGRMMQELRPRIDAAWPGIEWCQSRSADHVTELCRSAASDGYSRVIVAGGDGTQHFAVRGLVNTGTALGVLPVGTGNDFAMALGITPDTAVALDALARGMVQPIDAGSAGGIPFCCVAGIGLDAVALKAINDSPMPRSNFKYKLFGVRTLMTYRAVEARVVVDGRASSGPLLFVAFANTPTYAGGNDIVPDARIDDGLLDYCSFADTSRLVRLSTFARLTRGRHGASPGVSIGTVRHASVTSAEPLPVTLDGELTTLVTPVEIAVMPGALHVIRPLAADRFVRNG